MMKEAMTKADFERQEKGLPPFKVVKPTREEPEKPEVENEILFKDIDASLFNELKSAKRSVIRNKEGMRFIGFDVVMSIYQKGAFGRAKKIENGKPIDPEIITGWMNEGNFLELTRNFRETIKPQVIHW